MYVKLLIFCCALLYDVRAHTFFFNILILHPYPQIHDVSDKDVKNLEKKFKEGSTLRVRILGVRNLEGVALGTVKVITSCHSFFLAIHQTLEEHLYFMS